MDKEIEEIKERLRIGIEYDYYGWLEKRDIQTLLSTLEEKEKDFCNCRHDWSLRFEEQKREIVRLKRVIMSILDNPSYPHREGIIVTYISTKVLDVARELIKEAK